MTKAGSPYGSGSWWQVVLLLLIFQVHYTKVVKVLKVSDVVKLKLAVEGAKVE